MSTPGHAGESMGRTQWQRVAAILDEALDLEAAARPGFLARACAGDARLLSEVDALLAREGALAGFLEDGASAAAGATLEAAIEASIAEGMRIGAYRVVREIGRGGMGCVFLAERHDGLFERHAALKVLRPAVHDDETTARFDAERRLLAGLEHDGVARLIDAGVLDSGEPYIITEYVAGQPIDEYCRQGQLRLPERLALFGAVIDAVHHAHEHRVVHRDLKPSNILVTGDGRVKLIDFGIADVPGRVPAERSGARRRPDRRWLTPSYASPEQVIGEVVTTSTDVYQLGVVLYELLCGRRPFAAHESDIRALERAILQAEPVPPSRVVAVAGQRIDGDLDAIVARALGKRPATRYATARALGDDIERYLAGAPVLAAAGTLRYRCRKLVRRHRAASAAIAAVALTLLLAAGVSSWQAAEARRERDRARAATEGAAMALAQSRALTGILLDIFEAADPRRGEVADARAASALLSLGVAHADALVDQPAVKAELLEALARVQVRYGNAAEAESLAERALALRRGSAAAAAGAGTAHSLNTLALVRKQQGRFREAQTLHEIALAMQERVLGDAHPDVARTLTLLAA
jgi:eukaryotic-like serine/threonine-protein kinase